MLSEWMGSESDFFNFTNFLKERVRNNRDFPANDPFREKFDESLLKVKNYHIL